MQLTKRKGFKLPISKIKK